MRERNIKGIESYTLFHETRSDDDLYIDDVSVTYGQPTPDDNDIETLKISTCNNGVARYLKIETSETGFSFTDIDELVSIINDFKKRALVHE